MLPIKLFLLLVVLCVNFCPLVSADDKLHLRAENGVGQFMLKGEVVSWSGNMLNFRLSTSGLLKTYPTRDVINVETYQGVDYENGLKLLKNDQYAEAISPLKAALKLESRTWFKQDILAQLVICYINSNQTENAVDAFIQITILDPETRHLKLIPLPLLSGKKQTIPSAKAKLLSELGENNYQHLLGSAYLVHDLEHAPFALQKLEQLSFSSDPKVSFLAKTQLWRKSMDDKTPQGVLDLWQSIHDFAPLELQTLGGIILGEAYAQVGRVDQAIELWLRPWAENYPNQKLTHE
jgi:tetratricopeptide (TPR) repeat protein